MASFSSEIVKRGVEKVYRGVYAIKLGYEIAKHSSFSKKLITNSVHSITLVNLLPTIAPVHGKSLLDLVVYLRYVHTTSHLVYACGTQPMMMAIASHVVNTNVSLIPVLFENVSLRIAVASVAV